MEQTRQMVRAKRGLSLFTLAVLLGAGFLMAAEDLSGASVSERSERVRAVGKEKPAQRKRLAGLKPFTQEQMNDFLAERRNAVIATINKGGIPQLTPVIFYWDGTTFYITTTRETVKYKNIRRDPRISIIVDDVLDHRVVIAKGRAQIQEQDIWELTGKIIYKYYGQEEGDPYLEQLRKQNRVLVVLKPEQVRTWGPVPREKTAP